MKEEQQLNCHCDGCKAGFKCLRAGFSCFPEMDGNPQLSACQEINFNTNKCMYKFVVSWVNHGKPLVCPSPSRLSRPIPTIHSVFVRWSLRTAFLPPGFFIVNHHRTCFVLPLRRLGAHQTLTAALPSLLHLRLRRLKYRRV